MHRWFVYQAVIAKVIVISLIGLLLSKPIAISLIIGGLCEALPTLVYYRLLDREIPIDDTLAAYRRALVWRLSLTMLALAFVFNGGVTKYTGLNDQVVDPKWIVAGFFINFIFSAFWIGRRHSQLPTS